MLISKWNEEAVAKVNSMSSREKDRLRAIIAMNIMVSNMNDESAYMTWIYLVPDGSNEWDFIDFAVDNEGTERNHLFDEAVMLFKKLWDRYAKETAGLYIGGEIY